MWCGEKADVGRSSESLRQCNKTLVYTQLDAVVTFRPQVRAVLCVDHLRRDPDAVAALANAAFQNVSHAKLLCARVSGQGARSGTNFTRSSEPASWMA